MQQHSKHTLNNISTNIDTHKNIFFHTIHKSDITHSTKYRYKRLNEILQDRDCDLRLHSNICCFCDTPFTCPLIQKIQRTIVLYMKSLAVIVCGYYTAVSLPSR